MNVTTQPCTPPPRTCRGSSPTGRQWQFGERRIYRSPLNSSSPLNNSTFEEMFGTDILEDYPRVLSQTTATPVTPPPSRTPPPSYSRLMENKVPPYSPPPSYDSAVQENIHMNFVRNRSPIQKSEPFVKRQRRL